VLTVYSSYAFQCSWYLDHCLFLTKITNSY